MKTKKLKLNDLKVTSFVTEMNEKETLTINGGAAMLPYTGYCTVKAGCGGVPSAAGQYVYVAVYDAYGAIIRYDQKFIAFCANDAA